MKGFVNVHCHMLNFKFIPDEFFKTRAPIRERLLRSHTLAWLARLINFITPFRKYNRLHELLALYRKDIFEVAAHLKKEMEDAGIKLSVPLMMDLEYASFQKKPEIPYRHQIELVSRIALEYPGEIMPFVMVDPRRDRASDMTITALEEFGFLGVKMYPPLGYHPYHKAFFNEPSVNRELKAIYSYCQDNDIPITVHCSSGGAYSNELMRCEQVRKEITHPLNWRKVLQDFPGLNLNLAHFGGDFMDIGDKGSWSYEIMKMMSDFKHVFADLSYHDEALKKGSKEYFKLLNSVIKKPGIRNRVLFGTDWSMTRHTWNESEFIAPFIKSTDLRQLALINPMNFLFPGNKIPKRITRFFKDNGRQVSGFLDEYLSKGRKR
ncbi:amidohydrolase [Candidatus Woesearchaeota archaeon]|nr:amidohydrolase [Candidatus Woesearchaeota archaeon]